jgi:citronellol/citronellal dehydrogenase
MSDKPSPNTLRSPFRPGLFDGRVALITGGGTGIGRAIAEELGSLGASIAICGRRQEPLDECAAALEARSIHAYSATCDIRDADAVSNYVRAVIERFGRVDVLINNAGGQFPSPAAVMKPKGFEAVVRNNLVGTFNVTHAVANQAMIPQKSGRIVNIIANVFRGFPGMAHTGAARAGVENLTKSLAVEWAPFNIQVTAVAPGTIVSSGHRSLSSRARREGSTTNARQAPRNAGRSRPPRRVSRLGRRGLRDGRDRVHRRWRFAVGRYLGRRLLSADRPRAMA